MKMFVLFLSVLASLSAAAQDVFTYRGNYGMVALYGFADSAGNTLTPARYNLIITPRGGISRVWTGKKSEDDYGSIRYGFNRTNGTEVAPPIYIDARDFSEGMAAVALQQDGGSRFGFIDARGKVAVPFKYFNAKHFASGLAPVSTTIAGGEWCYIDKTGAVIIPGPFYSADTLSDGLAAVGVTTETTPGAKNHLMGYIDAKGNMVIPPAYSQAQAFRDGVAVVSFSEFIGNVPKSYSALIDKTGKRLTTKEYVEMGTVPYEGFYAVKLTGKRSAYAETDTWTVIDKTGKETPGFIVTRTPYFSDGLVSIQKGDKSGYVDKTGKVVIEPKYAVAQNFSDGMAAIKEDRNGMYGYINRKGEMVIPPKYITVNYFKEGLAAVATGKSIYDPEKKYGVIDKTGKIVTPFEYESIGEFKKGRAVAVQQGISFYLYRDGKNTLAADPATLSDTRYAIGLLGNNDVPGALEILKKLEDKNYPVAQYYEGVYLYQSKPPLQDVARGVELIRKAAVGGFSEAMYAAGVLHAYGASPDFAKALEWFLKAEAAGLAVSSRELGLMQEKGQGTPANPAKAALYYQKAADARDVVAMYQLALLYRDGRGVSKNNYKAIALINEAAGMGYQPAKDLQRQMPK